MADEFDIQMVKDSLVVEWFAIRMVKSSVTKWHLVTELFTMVAN